MMPVGVYARKLIYAFLIITDYSIVKYEVIRWFRVMPYNLYSITIVIVNQVIIYPAWRDLIQIDAVSVVENPVIEDPVPAACSPDHNTPAGVWIR